MSLIEHDFACPYCNETISMVLELIAQPQQYIEDCEVCCRPINLQYQDDGLTLTRFEACVS